MHRQAQYDAIQQNPEEQLKLHRQNDIEPLDTSPIPLKIRNVQNKQLHPIFYVEKVRERVKDGGVVDLVSPKLLKDDEMFKHMKHIHELDVVHNYFKNRAMGGVKMPVKL